MHTLKQILKIGMVLLSACSLLMAQQNQKPLTNADVIKMVKGGVPESVIVSAIQANKAKFDTSPGALIAMQKAGVTQAELDAIIASGKPSSALTQPPANTPVAQMATPAPEAASTGAKSRMPKVAVIQGTAAPQPLALEKTQLAQTKTKPSSMKSLAGDSVVTQAMQAGIGTATASATSRIGANMGSSSLQQAGGILSGMMARRKATVTYVWGVPGPASANVLQTSSPKFTVDFSKTPGINPDDYEPAIVKLTPAQNTCRLVGASEGKEDVRSTPTAEWQVYSHFLEEKVPVNSTRSASGKFEVATKSGLLPGEYALVLRPISKSKNFSGGDVARGQGDGMMFDSAWTFQISEDAE